MDTNTQPFVDGLGSELSDVNENDLNDKNEQSSNLRLDNKILNERIFLLNSRQPLIKVQCTSKLGKNLKLDDNSNDESFSEQINNNNMQTPSSTTTTDEFTIKEFNSTIKRTKNTSIQSIISQYERQQQVLCDDLKKFRSNKTALERQSSFDETKFNLKKPFIRSVKQKHLFPNKSIDQPMDLEEKENENSSSKFRFVKKNFEKILNRQSSLIKKDKLNDDKIKNLIKDKQQQNDKSIKHPLSIKQCIRKIDLNTTHQNILNHLENDVSLDQDSSKSSLIRSATTPSYKTGANDLTQLNSNSQPHYPIFLNHTKEVAGYNSISDAFLRLDFYNAIRDIRRFNYICKLLHLLITQNLTSLSGCATKFLFNLLEEIAFQVAGNQQNIHILHTLLRDVQNIMKMNYCWGRPIGSTILWSQHLKTIEKICQIVKNIEIKPPPNDGKKGFRDLPAELIRTILLQLSDYKDLVNSGKVNESMRSFLDEQYIWRELCKYHFANRQIKQFLSNNQGNKSLLLNRPLDQKIRRSNADNLNWEKVFHSLRK